MVAIGTGEPHLQLRVLPHAHQRQGVLLELLTRACQRRTVLGALEQGSTEQFLQHAYTRAHRRLGDVELASCVDETAGLGHHQEGAYKCNVHARLSLRSADGIYLSKSSIGVS